MGVRVVLAGLAAAVLVSPVTAAHVATTSPKDLTLRLADLPPGYRITNEGLCDLTIDFIGEDAPPALFDVFGSYEHEGCSVSFSNSWLGLEAAQRGQPPEVDSTAIVFREEAGAIALFDLGLEGFAHLLSKGPQEIQPSGPAISLGDEARVLAVQRSYALGAFRPGAAAVWRRGRVVSLVFVRGLGGRAGRAVVLALARRQHSRIERPTRLSKRETDDREVELDNPRLAVPVYWLGRTFAPGRGLPRVGLQDAQAWPGPSAVSSAVQLSYITARRGLGGVTIEVWKPAQWRRARRTREGRLIWSSPCARSARISTRGGFAVVYSGYESVTPKPCPRKRFDRFLAHVFLRGAVVTVNRPECLFCRGGVGGYNSVRGMIAIARGLELRR